MASIAPEQLLAEIEDIIRTMSPRSTIRHETPENFSWLGRASAAIRLWDPVHAAAFEAQIGRIHHSQHALSASQALANALVILHQASHELRMSTVGPMTVAIGQGSVFDYFDEVRKIIESAKTELFFVDPYLDAEFVSRYLPHATQGVSVRLLGRECMKTLLPAVELLRQQYGLQVEVRSAGGFHDRYVFVDGQDCYHSGASFKDGAKKAPTTLTQVVDAFSAVLKTYQMIWASATTQP